MTNLSAQFKKELESLNRGQREVVFSDPQNALVFAGPGSGKTQTVICRLGYLLAGSFFAPWNLLLLTFTKKAAEEMSNRIAHFGISVNGLIRGTFHHFGNWVLSRYVKFTDLKPNYTILDSEDQEEIVKNILNEYGYKSNKHFPKASELVELFSYTCNLYCDIGKVIAESDNSNMKKFVEDIRKIKGLYDNYKRTYNLVDYDDLLFKTLMLLKSNEMVRRDLAGKIKYVLVDEFQDTSRIQWEILKMFLPTSYIMVVGDDAQSIYGFRGANIGNIIEFKEVVPNVRVFELVENYRSSQQIVDFANEIIKQSTYVHKKKLLARFQTNKKPYIKEAADFFDEADFVVEKIKYLLREYNLNLKDIAVLYRKDFLSQSLQMRLIKEGIPFQVRSGVKFTELAHIKDIIAFAKILINPIDAVSWRRILIKLPTIGNTRAKEIIELFTKIYNHKQENVYTACCLLMEKLTDTKVKESLKQLLEVFKHIVNENISKPYEILSYILNNFYKEILIREYDNFKKRLEDVTGFINISKNYSNLSEFISDITVTTPIAVATDLNIRKDIKDYLVLSTIHQAKGLEWDAVFIIGVVDGELPDYRNVYDAHLLDEELRLLYVACTRAKRFLFLSYPREDTRNTFTKIFSISRFLEKLPPNLYEKEEE